MIIKSTVTGILKQIHFVVLILFSSIAFVVESACAQPLSTSCNVYLNRGPLDRSTGTGEVNIINGLYSGLAQRYNNVSGSVTGVRFWARVPLSVGTAQNVRVFIYQENVGFPGTVLGQTTVSVPSSGTPVEVNATFTNPVNVNNNIIISVEPFNVATTNVWLERNQDGNPGNNFIGDGGNLYLNLIKQGVTWFKDLANGDPSWDFDFLIMPLRTVNVTAAFTFNATNYTASFNNSSSGAAGYLWDFGDGTTSTQQSPSHTYSATGLFNVKLKAFSSDSLCYDSLTQVVNISLTGLEDGQQSIPFTFRYNGDQKQIILSSVKDIQLNVLTATGSVIRVIDLMRSQTVSVDVSQFARGVYFIGAEGFANKFIIQ
jgi:PKD repeat protein